MVSNGSEEGEEEEEEGRIAEEGVGWKTPAVLKRSAADSALAATDALSDFLAVATAAELEPLLP